MLSGGKVFLLNGLLQYWAKNMALLAKRFLGYIFISKSVFGYFKTKKVKEKSPDGH